MASGASQEVARSSREDYKGFQGVSRKSQRCFKWVSGAPGSIVRRIQGYFGGPRWFSGAPGDLRSVSGGLIGASSEYQEFQRFQRVSKGLWGIRGDLRVKLLAAL